MPKIISWNLVLLLSASAHALATQTDFEAPDKYSSFDELSRYEQEGVDYRIRIRDLRKKTSVLAIHGGGIEFGTSELAIAISGSEMNTYLFEGIKAQGNSALHITSTRFDERRALALASRSENCLSIHGYRQEEPRLCIGGKDTELGKRIADAIRSSGYSIRVTFPCHEYPGQDPKNIVNQCKSAGAQLEFSSGVRKYFQQNPNARERLAWIIRKATLKTR